MESCQVEDHEIEPGLCVNLFSKTQKSSAFILIRDCWKENLKPFQHPEADYKLALINHGDLSMLCSKLIALHDHTWDLENQFLIIKKLEPNSFKIARVENTIWRLPYLRFKKHDSLATSTCFLSEYFQFHLFATKCYFLNNI